MVTEGMDRAETWRVVLTDGDMIEVPVECIGEDSYLARFRHLAAWGGTPRFAVLRLASGCFGEAAEIVSPGGNEVRAILRAAEAEVTRLRAENDVLRKSTDAAVDGVRAMLPAALKIAREEGAAEMRERAAAVCAALSKGHNEHAGKCVKERDEEWQWGHAGGADECESAIRALPLTAPAEVKP